MTPNAIFNGLMDWIKANPNDAARLLTKFVDEASYSQILEIIGYGHEIGLSGLPQIED
jgi:hypothetical protein